MKRESFSPGTGLSARYIELIPWSLEHVEPLRVASRDPEVQRWLRHAPGYSTESVRAYVAGYERAIRAGQSAMFVVRLRTNGRVVGATGYHHIDAENESAEIGGTWYDSDVWRTAVNSECKWLLLRHAFEVVGAHRVYLQTDLRNRRSQQAISDLGAIREAELRENVRLSDGYLRTSVVFGILAEEWPRVRASLEARLARPWTPPDPVPVRLEPTALSRGPVPPPEPEDAAESALRVAPRITGTFVDLEPLDLSAIPELTFAGRDPKVWQFLRFGPRTDRAGMTDLVETLLRQQQEGEVLPFVVRSRALGRAIGIVRYLEINRSDRDTEIGTWLDSDVWRTPVNTEVKFLMLRHAFETSGYHRVQLRTDSFNERSQRAIERLGARHEGVAREHLLLRDGRWRTSIYYSILSSEWPAVNVALRERISRPWTPAVLPRSGA